MRAYDPSDAKAVLAINAECIPEVGNLDAEKLAYFEESASFFVVAEVESEVVGFLIGLDEHSIDYPSPNYAWFAERYPSFAYVDRIAISASGRGLGLGPDMYRAFEAWGVGHGKECLLAEVNTVPDNPRSHHFHDVFGFTEVARCRPYGPDEQVAMYEKRLR